MFQLLTNGYICDGRQNKDIEFILKIEMKLRMSYIKRPFPYLYFVPIVFLEANIYD